MDRIATASADFAVNRATREDVADIATLLRDEQGTPVGTLQLTFVPGLSRGGAMRMTSDLPARSTISPDGTKRSSTVA